MCVQYRRGYLEYRGGIIINVGDILSTMGCSVPWGYHDTCGGDIMSIVQGGFSTMEALK